MSLVNSAARNYILAKQMSNQSSKFFFSSFFFFDKMVASTSRPDMK